MVTLEQSYEQCRLLNKRSGTTYYWSTHLLPNVKRHHVHALYGLCRYADDIVDDMGSDATNDQRAAALKAFENRFFADLEKGRSDDPVLKAVVHTFRAFERPRSSSWAQAPNIENDSPAGAEGRPAGVSRTSMRRYGISASQMLSVPWSFPSASAMRFASSMTCGARAQTASS